MNNNKEPDQNNLNNKESDKNNSNSKINNNNEPDQNNSNSKVKYFLDTRTFNNVLIQNQL